MNIDLNKCKIGDILQLRDGTIATYHGKCDKKYQPHKHCVSANEIPSDNGEDAYMDSGHYWSHRGFSKFDVVSIIRLTNSDVMFSNIPDDITEIVCKGKRYKKEFKWVEISK